MWHCAHTSVGAWAQDPWCRSRKGPIYHHLQWPTRGFHSYCLLHSELCWVRKRPTDKARDPLNYNLQLLPGYFRFFVPREQQAKRGVSTVAVGMTLIRRMRRGCFHTVVAGGVNEELRPCMWELPGTPSSHCNWGWIGVATGSWEGQDYQVSQQGVEVCFTPSG